MKFTSIFFTASESILEVYLKNTHKRARNTKFASIFFTASESILEIYLKYTNNPKYDIGLGLIISFFANDCKHFST